MKCKNLIISSDLGTSYVKAGLYDERGNCRMVLKEKAPQKYLADGSLEQNADDYTAILIKILKTLVEDSGLSARDVKAIVFTGQMAGAVGIDREWNAVTIWSGTLDTRQNRIINNAVDAESILSLSGTNLPFMAKKIKWFEKEYKSEISRIVKYIGLSSYVAGIMTKKKAEDAFIGNTYLTWTGIADIRKMAWSEKLCSMFRISSSVLPVIVDSSTVVGKLSSQAAALCGLVEGIPVVCGAGDKVSGCIGAGAVMPGILVDECGTISAMSLCTNAFIPDIKYKMLETLPSAISGQYFPLFFIFGSGSAIDWFINNFAFEEKQYALDNNTTAFQILDKKADKISPGSDNLMCIGLLGGRALPFNPDIRGMWIGHSFVHTKVHFYRALLESYAYEYYGCLKVMREYYRDLSFKNARVIGGGGATSELWNRIKTDALGVPYEQLDRDDCALLGAAIIGGYAIGMFENIADTAKEFVSTRKIFEVEKKTNEKYARLSSAYKYIIEKNKEVFEKLASKG